MNANVGHKSNRSKESWVEDIFLTYFNEVHPKFYLLKCSQDYNTFDYWMIGNDERSAQIVELKIRPGKKAYDDEFALLDYLKIIKLRSYAIGINCYVFFCYEDMTLVFDTAWEIQQFKETVWNHRNVLLAGWYAKKAKTLKIGLSDLRSIHSRVQAEIELDQKLGAMSQETEAPAVQENSLELTTPSVLPEDADHKTPDSL